MSLEESSSCDKQVSCNAIQATFNADQEIERLKQLKGPDEDFETSNPMTKKLCSDANYAQSCISNPVLFDNYTENQYAKDIGQQNLCLKTSKRKDKNCHRIHEEFLKYSFECMTSDVKVHQCSSIQNEHRRSNNGPDPMPKCNTFPRLRDRHSPLTLSLAPRSYRISQDSFTPSGLNFHPEEGFDDSVSVFNDVGETCEITAGADNQMTLDVSGPDYRLYTSASLCAHHPVLATKVSQEVLRQDMLQSKSARVVSEKLQTQIRCLYPQITNRNHSQYQAMQQHNDKEQKLMHHLYQRLSLLDGNQQLYYTESGFKSKEQYERWKLKEKNEILHLIGTYPPPPANDGVFDSETCRVCDYSLLVDKILKRGNIADQKSQRNRMASCLSDRSIPESVASSLWQSNSSIISRSARRLLKEFALRYRISEITQCECTLKCMSAAIDGGVIEMKNNAVIVELIFQMETVVKLLRNEENFILTTELQSLADVSEKIIIIIKSAMLEVNDLSLLLKLLKIAFCFLTSQNKAEEDKFYECVKESFKSLIRFEYNKARYFSCKCKDPLSGLPCHQLLRCVDNSIAMLKNGSKKDYHNAFSEHMDNVSVITAEVLYCCIMDNIEEIERAKVFASPGEEELNAIFVLMTKLNEFEQAMENTRFQLQTSRWRQIFHSYTPAWLAFIRTKLERIVMSSVRHDDVTEVVAKHGELSFTCSLNSNPSTSSLGDEVFSTRVPSNCSSESESDSERKETVRRQQTQAFESEKKRSIHEELPHQQVKSTAVVGTIRDDSEDVLQCTESVVYFMVLLNRFFSFSGKVSQNLYGTPVLPSDNEYRVTFCFEVFKCARLLIKQYCDCMLNLDLCGMRTPDLKTYVKKEKLRELQRRSNKKCRTVDCCRHQLAGQPCQDNINQDDIFEKDGIYFKMAHHINNVALISSGMEVIWKRFTYLLDIDDVTMAPTICTQKSSDGIASITNSHATAKMLTEWNESIRSKSSSKNDQTENIDDNICLDTNNNTSSEEETLVCGKEMGAVSSSNGETFLDKSNEENSTTDFKMLQLSKRSLDLNHSLHGPAETSFCKSQPSTTTTQPFSPSKEKSSNTFATDNRSARNHLEEDQQCYSHITECDIPQQVDETSASVEDCLESLSGVFTWRVTQHLLKALRKVFRTQDLKLQFNQQSEIHDKQLCVNHCRPLVDKLNKTFDFFYNWLLRDAQLIARKAFWKILTKEFKREANSFNVLLDEIRTRSTVMRITVQEMLMFFNKRQLELTHEESESLEPLLPLLELLAMPTSRMLRLYAGIEEKSFNCLGDDLPNRVIRKLCRERKSFTGSQLIQSVILNMHFDKSNSEDRQRAFQLCDRLYKHRVIILLNKKRDMPYGLVKEPNEFTSSCVGDNSDEMVRKTSTTFRGDNKILLESISLNSNCYSYFSAGIESQATVSRGDNNEFFLSGSSSDLSMDSINLSESSDRFVADDKNFYAFSLTPQTIPFLHFSNSEGKDLDVNFLNKLLLARRHYDTDARYYLRRRGVISRRFILVPCLP